VLQIATETSLWRLESEPLLSQSEKNAGVSGAMPQPGYGVAQNAMVCFLRFVASRKTRWCVLLRLWHRAKRDGVFFLRNQNHAGVFSAMP